MTPTQRGGLVLVLALVVAGAGASSSWWSSSSTLPAELSNAEFWDLIEEFSEPDGYFQSDNLVSNEHSFQYVVSELGRRRRPQQVYLGVAPDQNFTYMLALEPQMAFIVDIRRGNLITHLLYKAIFELSEDRADFLSWLFSRPRPAGLAAGAPIDALMETYTRVAPDELAFRDNLVAVQYHLTRTRGFELDAADLRVLDEVYSQFYLYGPSLTYSSSPRGMGGGFRRGGGRGLNRFPTWGEMIRQVDQQGVQRGYLTDEASFQAIRNLQLKNLIVPVVGDHTGPKALRAVGRYIRERGATVGAFYTSNVEQYLFRYGTWPRFAENLRYLPLTDASVIIRSVAPRDGYRGVPQGPDGRSSVVDPILPLLRDVEAGRITGYRDVTGR